MPPFSLVIPLQGLVFNDQALMPPAINGWNIGDSLALQALGTPVHLARGSSFERTGLPLGPAPLPHSFSRLFLDGSRGKKEHMIPATICSLELQGAEPPAPPTLPAPSAGGRKTLFDRLIEEKLATRDEVQKWGVEAQSVSGWPGTIACRQWLRDGQLEKLERFKVLIQEVYDVPPFNLSEVESIDRDILTLVPRKQAEILRCIPINRVGETLYVVMAEPLNANTIDTLRFMSGCRTIDPLFATEQEISDAILKIYGHAGVDDIVLRPTDDSSSEETPASAQTSRGRARTVDTQVGSNDPVVVHLVKRLLATAYDQGASDIHIEPQKDRLSIRFRIDGVLRKVLSSEREIAFASISSAVVARILILSGLALDKTHLPQSGGFTATGIGLDDVDVRVEVRPTTHGPEAVLRLLRSGAIPQLETLGFSAEQWTVLRKAGASPNGLLLVTGPTGSGKTTTLYSLLSELNRPGVKIVTAENPIEYQLDGVSQTEIHVERGLDFPGALRSFLRSNPDIILVGEIRDAVTAQMAADAAGTGHLVLSSLHTNDVLSTAERLVRLGIPDFIVVDILRVVVAQKLARKICPDCKTPVEDIAPLLLAMGLPPEQLIGLFEGRGCRKCKGTGCIGRIGIYEVIPANDILKRYILGMHDGSVTRHLTERLLREAGIPLLRDSATALVQAGIISPKEFLRVVGISQ